MRQCIRRVFVVYRMMVEIGPADMIYYVQYCIIG